MWFQDQPTQQSGKQLSNGHTAAVVPKCMPRQADRQTDRQTDRRTDRQTDTGTETQRGSHASHAVILQLA